MKERVNWNMMREMYTGWFYKTVARITFERKMVEPSLGSHSNGLGEL